MTLPELLIELRGRVERTATKPPSPYDNLLLNEIENATLKALESEGVAKEPGP